VSSIRRALTVWLVGGMLCLLALLGGTLYLLVREQLTAQFDAGLTEKARVLAGLMKQEHDGFELDLGETPMPEFERGADAEYFQIWLGTGVFARSASLRGGELARGASGTIADLSLPDGRPGRLATLTFPVRVESSARHPPAEFPPPATAVLAIARGRAPLDQALGSVRWAIGSVGLALLLFVPLLVAQVVRRKLGPLAHLARQATEIDARSLGQRFPIADLPAELHPIATRLNDLLERLSGAFERERRFSADVAHELRTPIAELRALAEVELQAPESPTLARHFQDVLGAALQMEKLVTTLLTLARCEAGRQPVSPEPLELARVLREAWAPLAEKARRKDLKVTPSTADALVTTDRLMLTSILGNLLANAVEYAPTGGELGWSIAALDGGVEVVISNSNGTLEHADLERAFEPFWRKDAARSDGQHGGLGLSLVAAFARLIDAEARLALAGPQVRASLLLRRAGGPAGQPAA
jgi:signal transduction histidine kinase